MGINPEDFYDDVASHGVEFFTGVPDSLLKELLRRRPDIPYNPYDDKRPLPLPTLHNIICKDGVYYATFEKKIKGISFPQRNTILAEIVYVFQLICIS